MAQTRLETLKQTYSLGAYNKYDDQEQWIRISEGCPNNCPYCYEPQEIKLFGIPEITRNTVKIIDMNLLCKKEALTIIRSLGDKKVNGKVVYYELVCGVDFRFITQEIGDALKSSRFIKIRLAWDWFMKDQYKIRDAIKILLKAGYKPDKIMVFMVCNWKISYEECCHKLDLCKIWNVQASDCWFDNQTSPNIIPLYWKDKQIKDFRHKCRVHNQMVNFKIDPNIK